MISGSIVRYMDWQGSLILQNNALCYIQNSNIECGTCRLYTFQLNRPI